MLLEIVTPEAVIFNSNVDSVSVPGINGEFQMLNNHAAIVALLMEGTVKFKGNPTIAEGYQEKFTQNDGQWSMAISGGTIEMNNNKVMVLAD